MNFVCIGKIVKPQGIKGEVKIKPEIDCPALFREKCSLFIEKVETKVLSRAFRQGMGYVHFEGVNSRDDAEKLRSKRVFVSIEDFDKFSADNFLVDDLVGCQIFDETGALAGQIMGVTDYGFDDVLIVKCDDGRLYEIPFKKDIFVVKKDGRNLEISCERREFEGAKVEREE